MVFRFAACCCLLLLFFGSISCKTAPKPTQPIPIIPQTVETTLQITTLKANDLEESLAGQDELILAYSLTAIDADSRTIEAANGTWGVQKTTKGAVFGTKNFKPISLKIPINGKVVASIVLIEVDDYQTTQRWLKEAQKVATIAGVPVAVWEVGALLTPLKYVSAALVAAGVGFDLTQKLDGDDVLGQTSYELSYARASQQPALRVPLSFKGKRALTTYDYDVMLELKNKK